MIALLSAARLLAWRPCRGDACSLQIPFTGKIQTPLEKAIWLPEAVRRDHDSKVLNCRANCASLSLSACGRRVVSACGPRL
jgi:hypothetical protein